MTIQRAQKGFSLVELIISMALGLILTLGVIQLYLANKETYRVTDAMAGLQEDARYLMSRMTWDIRNADANGCTQGTSTNTQGYFAEDSERGNNGGVNDLREMASDWSIPESAVVVGWEYDGTGPGESFDLEPKPIKDTSPLKTADSDIDLPSRIDTDWLVKNSDALLLQTSEPMELDANINGSGGNNISLDSESGIPAGTVLELMAPDCHAGYRFVKGNNENATSISVDGKANVPSASINDPKVNTQDATLLQSHFWFYFVGIDPNDKERRGLFRKDLANPDVDAQPELILPGVETMQLTYGVPAGGGGVEYVTGDGSISDWSQVVSLNMGFVEASGPRIRAQEQSRSFSIIGSEVRAPEDRRVRMSWQKTISFRN